MKWLTLVITFIFCAAANAAPLTIDHSLITLNGPWKFKTGDNQQWANPNFDDSHWETVDLTAPAGAHDGDVGLTGYVPGWAAKGHGTYAGYAWYRIHISLDSLSGNTLALAGPPAVDDAYQIFINGKLWGSAGDFSKPEPVIYSIQPRIFILPDSIKHKGAVTIAFRVWMSAATLSGDPQAGGIRIAPMLGEKSAIQSKYNFQWRQTIKGYIVDAVEPAIFILLAVISFILYRSDPKNTAYLWIITAFLFTALVRANQPFFYWFQIESAHEFDLVTTVILMPLVIGSWLMAWRTWFKLSRPIWMPKAILILTLPYMCSQLLRLTWLPGAIPHTLFRDLSNYIRLIFVAMMLYIIYSGIQQNRREGWLALPAVLLISTGLFAQELSELHIPGIWFPYGVGVSRTQYAYLAFDVIILVLLISRARKLRKQKLPS
ncbi:glycoside hydrolase [Mucilaginibacter sp. OK098]|uniref:glycoside hydrolase n=1 Tax=Mucilaginibacter sp. OK098 TaxID=1855297 RepID=UPI00091A6CA7|nr:glycoside hydrolase [Mucilaginibacter sp. OK098]SHM54380.1 hypothetical protein SAMN05216524_102465 [Mucilaginibacter sp. OK098]